MTGTSQPRLHVAGATLTAVRHHPHTLHWHKVQMPVKYVKYVPTLAAAFLERFLLCGSSLGGISLPAAGRRSMMEFHLEN